MIEVHGKLGTFSSDVFTVRGNKQIKVKDKIYIKSESDQRCLKWTHVIVDRINEDNFYFFSLL